MQCPLPTNPNWVRNTARFGSKESFKSFVENNTEIYNEHYIMANKEGLKFMNGLLGNLKARFGIDYSIIPNNEMSALTGIEEYRAPKGLIMNGKIYINRDKMTIEAAFHEYLHPIIEYIDQVKPETIDKFWQDLQDIPEGKESLEKIMKSEEYRKLGKFDGDELNREGRKEAIVTVIGRLAEQDFTQLLGSKKLSKPMYDRIKSFVRELWEGFLDFIGLPITITPDLFNENTSLSFMSQMMSLTDMGLDFSIDENFHNKFRKNMFTSYLTDSNLTQAGKVMEELNIFLKRRIQVAENLGKKSKLLELKYVERDFEAAKNKAEAFRVMVDYASEEIGTSYSKMLDLVKNLSSKEPLEAMKILQAYYSSAEKFLELFTRIENELLNAGISHRDLITMESEVGSPMHKVKQILSDAKGIMVTHKQQVIPAMAKVLEPYYGNTGEDSKITKELKHRLEGLRSRLNEILLKEKRDGKLGFFDNKVKVSVMNEITKNTNLLRKYAPGFAGLVDQLTEASEDIGFLDKFLTPAISSSDPVLASFAVLLKNSMERVRLRVLSINNTVIDGFREFRDATRRSVNNVEKFNEGLFEKIQIMHNGSLVTTYGFVQEINMTAYTEDYLRMKELQETYQKQGKTEKAREVFDNFMTSTRTPLSRQEIDDILDDLKAKVKSGHMSQAEFNEFIVQNMYNATVRDNRRTEWSQSNMTYQQMYANQAKDLLELHAKNGNISYQGKLAKIDVNKYKNPKYEQLKADPVKFKYYKTLLDQYLASQELLPESQRRGHILPGIRKEGWDRLVENGLINHVKDEVIDSVKGNIEGRDEERTGVNWGASSSESYAQKLLPIYYTSILPETEVSVDLQRSVIMFSRMAEKYAALEKIHPVVEGMSNISKNRKVAKTDSLGNKLMEAFAGALGYSRVQKEDVAKSNLAELTEAFIDMQVYGETQLVEEFTMFGVKMDFGKIANTLTSIASKRTIGGDFLKAVANMTQAKMMEIVEIVGGEFIDKNSFLKGESDYMTEVAPQVMSDMYRPSPISFHGKLIEAFDPLQGEFMNSLGQKVSKSTARKMFSWDTWFMGIHAGEHYAQVSMFYGMMHHQKITGPNGKQVPLAKAYELRDGQIRLKSGFDPSWDIGGENMLKFIAKVHSVNKRLHGVYNEFDYLYAQRFGLGRLMMMFRKFAPPGFKRRFKRLGYNAESNNIDEGMYNTWMSELLRQRGKLWNMLMLDKNLTPLQRQNIRRTNAEITLMLLTGVAVYAIGGADADDDYLTNFSRYQAKRLNSELLFYVSIPDFLRILNSPSATTTTVQQFWKTMDYTLFTWDPDKLEYQRKTGMWEKGDSKTKAQWFKLLGITGYNLHPEEAVKILDFTR